MWRFGCVLVCLLNGNHAHKVQASDENSAGVVAHSTPSRRSHRPSTSRAMLLLTLASQAASNPRMAAKRIAKSRSIVFGKQLAAARRASSMKMQASQQKAPLVDGSAAASVPWDREALLRGYLNNAEIAAKKIDCKQLPSDLVGTYYRNGHARFIGYDGRKARHPFDGDGMVTGITLDGRLGTAIVRQRYVATEGAIAERKAGRTIYPGQFGNPLPFWAGGANFKNVANTNVLWHAGKLLALWEGGRPHELDPLSLATIREWNIDGLIGDGPTDGFAAHPRKNTEGGFTNFAVSPNPVVGTTALRIWDFAPDSFSLIYPAQIREVPGFAFSHDFIVTESWNIFVIAPTTFGPAGQPLTTLKNTFDWIAGKRSVSSMIEFGDNQPVIAYFFPRRAPSDPPISVELDSFFSFHHANAYEDPITGTVTFDTIRTDKLKVDDSSLSDDLQIDRNRFLIEDIDYERDVPRTDLVRYVVDLKQRSFVKTPLSTRHVEFPSVAPSVRAKQHRYVYSSPGGSATGVTPQCGVLKTDTTDASRSQIWLPDTPHEFCGEVIFTPRIESTTEDDGYLLTLCFNGKEGTSTLLVLDAREVAAGPIAQVPLTTASDEAALTADAMIAGPGHGLHATFVPGLAPSLAEVRTAEEQRRKIGARFLSDDTI